MALVSRIFDGFAVNKWTKLGVTVGGCAVVGLSAYSLHTYYKNKNKMIDEGFEDISTIDDPEKKILVLGLNGSGKSNFLSHLSKNEKIDKQKRGEPTEGFNVVSVSLSNGKTLNFLEIRGSENAYWSNFVQDTDVLVYVVDSSDDHKLPESILELQKLIACDKLKKVPIIILANKQDLQKALPPENIAEVFGLKELSRFNKIVVLPLQVPDYNDESLKSVEAVKKLIIKMCCG